MRLLQGAVLCLIWASGSLAMMPGMGGKQEPKAPATKSDIKFIKCQACEKLVKVAISATAKLREQAEAKPGNKVWSVFKRPGMGGPAFCSSLCESW